MIKSHVHDHFTGLSRPVHHEYLSVPHRTPQFNTSVPHKKHTFSAPKMPQFNTKNRTVQHQNLLSFISKIPQFQTNLLVRNWGVFGIEQRSVLNWGVFCVELRNFGGLKGVALLCWTDVHMCWTEGGLMHYPWLILLIKIKNSNHKE